MRVTVQKVWYSGVNIENFVRREIFIEIAQPVRIRSCVLGLGKAKKAHGSPH